MMLLPVLLFTFISSTFTLAFLLSLFLAHRLYLHLTVAAKSNNEQYLSEGVRTWANETKGRVDLSPLGVNRVRWADNGGWATTVKQEPNLDGLRLHGTGASPAA
jgi:hypothetical protein